MSEHDTGRGTEGVTGTRYVVVLNGREVELPPEGVIWWVRGVADAVDEPWRLDVLSPSAPEDTSRIQALQIGDQAGWFDYRWVRRGDG